MGSEAQDGQSRGQLSRRYHAAAGNHRLDRQFPVSDPVLLHDPGLIVNASITPPPYSLYRRDVLRHIISETKSKGYVFQMEMMVRARALGYSVGEVPITFVDRIEGQSKMDGGEIVQYLKGVFQLWRDV